MLQVMNIEICGEMQASASCLSLGTADVIVTVGGEDDKVVLRSVESFDPVTSQWKSLACLPFAVSKHGLVVSGEQIFSFVFFFFFVIIF